MSARAVDLGRGVEAPGRRFQAMPVVALLIVAATIALAEVAPWAWRPPRNALPPVSSWLTDFFAWLGGEASLGPFTVGELTRAIAWLLGFPLAWSEAALAHGLP